MGLCFHVTWSPREGLFGERRQPALLLEAARAMKQREGRSNDVSDDNSESECPHVSESDTECTSMDESEHGSDECDGEEMSAHVASAVHALRRGTLGGIFIWLAPQQPYS